MMGDMRPCSTFEDQNVKRPKLLKKKIIKATIKRFYM